MNNKKNTLFHYKENPPQYYAFPSAQLITTYDCHIFNRYEMLILYSLCKYFPQNFIILQQTLQFLFMILYYIISQYIPQLKWNERQVLKFIFASWSKYLLRLTFEFAFL